jgi:hypothetical protein
MGIRILTSLVGIVVGILVAAAILDDFDATTGGIVVATIVFWLVSIVVGFLALKIFMKEPSVSLALLLALASTIVSLVVVNLIVSDVSISGAGTYLIAGLIIWICTAIADVVGTRMIRERRRG